MYTLVILLPVIIQVGTLGSKYAVGKISELRSALEKCGEDVIVVDPNDDLVEDPFVPPQIIEYVSYPGVKLITPAKHRKFFGIVHTCKKLGEEDILSAPYSSSFMDDMEPTEGEIDDHTEINNHQTRIFAC